MIDSTETLTTIYEKSRSRELYSQSINEDPVTGYPYETPQVREKLIEMIQEAIYKNAFVLYVDGDIDHLKVLNDSLGKKKTNAVIKATIEEKESSLLSIDGIDSMVFYRPQAGGDEFHALLFLNQGTTLQENTIKVIEEALNKNTSLMAKDGSVINIACSYGITEKQLTGVELAADLLHDLEQQSEEKLVREKMEKITKQLIDTLESGVKLTTYDYIELIVEEWGARRLGKEVLKALLISTFEKNSTI